MIPQEELDRALARWKARKLGQAVPAGGNYAGLPQAVADDDAPIHEEPTRVAAAGYSSQVETPQAEVHSEVHLNDSDFEDHTHR
jgi:hypothetical protein